MTVLNKDQNRSRVVMFRLSPSEYEVLKSACLAANNRSISDYMRAELLDPLQSGSRGSSTQRRFSEIGQALGELHSLIRDLSGRLSALEPALSRAQPPEVRPAMSQ
ncbi:MAG: hypothetical protein LAP87_03130 [Acidobacteriia bacterium]|nr:hypothetical protein [Terriglobia bacterium]